MQAEPNRRVGLVVLAVSLLVVFGLLELASRSLSPDRYYVWPPNFEHTFDPAPGVVQGVTFPSQLTINELGIRGSMPGDAKYHLLAIGGSTTICAMLDDSRAWPFRLQAHLNEALGEESAWVGNVGRPGHTTRQHVLQADKLLDEHPFVDAIVLLVGANDFLIKLASTDPEIARQFLRKTSRQEELAGAFALTPLWEDDLPWYARNFVGRTIHRLRWTPVKREAGLAPMDREGEFFATVRGYRRRAGAFETELPELDSALLDYRNQLMKIIDIAWAADVQVIFLTQPALWRAGLSEAEQEILWMGGPALNRLEDGATYFSAEAMARGLQQYNEVLLEVCQERGVECVDTAEAIPRDMGAFYDDAHFTDAGADSLAKVVASQLIQDDVLARMGQRDHAP